MKHVNMAKISRIMIPSFLSPWDQFHEKNFSVDQGDGFRMIQGHYIHCALYFSSYATIDLTGGSGPQLGGWGPCFSKSGCGQ